MFSSLFELIHIDTWGPYYTPAYDGFRYFLTIVDDYTRATWTHLMGAKSNAFDLLQSFITLVETQFQTKVKVVRSDNALELGSSLRGIQYFSSKGIIHQTSCPYTPQQNGVVERKHKHLLETSRALLFQSHLPIRFWGDCLLTATYLINRFPSPILNNQSPFELFYNKAPLYSHLKAFRCLCYSTVPIPHRDKLSPRELFPVSLLATLLAKRDTSFITSNQRFVLFLGMLFFMKLSFLFCQLFLPLLPCVHFLSSFMMIL